MYVHSNSNRSLRQDGGAMSHNFTRILGRSLCAVLLCFLVSIPMTTAHAASTEDHSGYTEISDAKGLQAIANDPHGKYVLMSDISLKEIDWYPINFYGTIDGNGHTIYDLKSTQLNSESNISVDGNDKKYETYFSGLFGQTENAVIKNLNMKACDIKISTEKNCFVACIVGYTANTEITNCSVQGNVYLYSKNTMCGVAGIVGFGYGTVTGCQADVTLVIVDQSDKSKKCEQFLGGILASGYTDIDSCKVNIKGYASIHGYAHNGGLVGMHYIHTSDNYHAGYVSNNSVNGVISFFENNKDRRAYCSAYIGETLNAHVSNHGNTTISFTRDERFDYTNTLLPNLCVNPVYTEAVTEPTCTAMGFTTYTCKTCDYSYIANYTFPAHKPGELKTVLAPTDLEYGLKRSYCTVCGQLIEEVKIPKLIYLDNSILVKKELTLSYKSKFTLSAAVGPEDAANWKVIWTSSDDSVVKVNEVGELTATGRGNAIVTCSMEDGTALGECTVTVKYIFSPWVIAIILIGWVMVLALTLIHFRRKERRIVPKAK